MKQYGQPVDRPTPEAAAMVARARALTRDYYLSDFSDQAGRTRILRELFGKMGENVVIDTPLHCNYGKNISIGNHVIINMNCTFVDDAKIMIGSRVLIASNVQFYTATHAPEPVDRLLPECEKRGTLWFRTYAAPIVVADGVWIGGGAIILPGVTIGENSVIGAGSVVPRSIPANCVAVGNPCRPIRFFSEQELRQGGDAADELSGTAASSVRDGR